MNDNIEPLDPSTKELFKIGMKEWRISFLYVDRRESSFSIYRIIANNAREALEIYFDAIREDPEDEFNEYFKHTDDIHSLCDFDDDNVYNIPRRWNGIIAPGFEFPSASEVDPFEGSIDLIKEYPDGFKWDE